MASSISLLPEEKAPDKKAPMRIMKIKETQSDQSPSARNDGSKAKYWAMPQIIAMTKAFAYVTTLPNPAVPIFPRMPIMIA